MSHSLLPAFHANNERSTLGSDKVKASTLSSVVMHVTLQIKYTMSSEVGPATSQRIQSNVIDLFNEEQCL